MKDFSIMYNEAMFALLLWLPRKLIVEKSSIFGVYGNRGTKVLIEVPKVLY